MSQRSLRVLVATSVHLPHDARIIRELLSLSEAGHDCTLLAPWVGAEGTYPFRCLFFHRKAGLHGRLLAQFMFMRMSLLKRWDVIHFHDFDLTPAAILVRLLSWQRLIYDVHENYAEEVMVRGYIPSAIRIPLKHLVNAVEWLAARIIRRMVVVVPVQVERFNRWGCPRIALVRNFATTSFAPKKAIEITEPGEDNYVINIGGQTLEYGAMLVLHAAAELHKKNHNINIIGIDRFEGSPGLREKVIQQSQIIAPNYRLLPRIPHQELGSYLTKSVIGLSIRLNTSNQRMGIPTKIFEYMAYGIPIIATDVGYQAEIIRDTGAGVLVPADDACALAQAIAELWQDSDRRACLGKAGRNAFFTKYCWESEARELLRFYDESAS